MGELKGLKPERVFYYFEELTKIPRCSFEEEKVSNYLKKTGEKLGLETIQDDLNNIIIRKPATKGYENAIGVVLQGHMDMVCEKEEESSHDFICDPIDIYIDGDFVRANKTTLGADNGMGIAIGLAILEDDSLEHPEIELLATVNEEVTMGGALGLSKDILRGRRYINIDSEEEGTLIMGAAGGEGIDAKIELEYENVHNYSEYSLEIKGLAGGHSGMEIDKPLENANKILNELIKAIKEISDLRIISIDGGSKDNAIPRSAQANIAIKEEDKEIFEKSAEDIVVDIMDRYRENEENLEIIIEEIALVNKALTKQKTDRIIYLLDKLHTGPYTMIEGNEEIVESSANMAIVKTDNKNMTIVNSIRSSAPKLRKKLADKTIETIEKVNESFIRHEGYPEWEYKKESELRDIAIKTYKDMTGEELKTTVLHAGLECGVINEKYPDMDFISIGPDMYDVHTPEERVSISSTERVYNYLIELLKNLK